MVESHWQASKLATNLDGEGIRRVLSPTDERKLLPQVPVFCATGETRRTVAQWHALYVENTRLALFIFFPARKE